MQGVRCRPMAAAAGGEVVGVVPPAGGRRRPSAAGALTIDGGEAPERRIERLIRENPVVIFSRRGCCMCHVMKRLLASVGVHPTVIELEAEEETAAAAAAAVSLPAVFIGGIAVGGIEGLMGLHLSGRLVPRLREVGALWG